jgi:hypothetical protein
MTSGPLLLNAGLRRAAEPAALAAVPAPEVDPNSQGVSTMVNGRGTGKCGRKAASDQKIEQPFD